MRQDEHTLTTSQHVGKQSTVRNVEAYELMLQQPTPRVLVQNKSSIRDV